MNVRRASVQGLAALYAGYLRPCGLMRRIPATYFPASGLSAMCCQPRCPSLLARRAFRQTVGHSGYESHLQELLSHPGPHYVIFTSGAARHAHLAAAGRNWAECRRWRCRGAWHCFSALGNTWGHLGDTWGTLGDNSCSGGCRSINQGTWQPRHNAAASTSANVHNAANVHNVALASGHACALPVGSSQ